MTGAAVVAAAPSAAASRRWTARRTTERAWRVAFAAAVERLIAAGQRVPVPGPPRRRPGEDDVTYARRWRRWKRRAATAGLTWPDAITVCGSVWAVKVCPECGRVDVRTARRVASCGRRFCPLCARRRANLKAARLLPAVAEVIRRGAQNLYLVTYTVRRDIDDPTTYDVDPIRRRARAIVAGVVAVRRYVGSIDPHMGEHAAPDVGVRGGYHMHGLLAAREFPWAEAQAVYRAALARHGMDGNLDFRVVHRAGTPVEESEIIGAVAEVIKYPGKCPTRWRRVDVTDADVDQTTGEILRDASVGVMGGVGDAIDPDLAARHELALYGLNLNRWYGRFRACAVPDDADLDADEAVGTDGVHDPDPPTCPRCGSPAPPQLVRYGRHDHATGRCLPDVACDDLLDRAQLAAGLVAQVAARWDASPADVSQWVDARTRRDHGRPWIMVAGPLELVFGWWIGPPDDSDAG